MLFEKASKKKLRFDTSKGQITVEDLWDLPLTSTVANKPNLDDIAKALHKQLKSDDSISFVATDTKKTDDVVQLKFDIVKHIIDVKMAENKKATEEKDRAAKKQQILDIMATKQTDALQSKSLEELQKLFETL